jgi:hypothetical protein
MSSQSASGTLRSTLYLSDERRCRNPTRSRREVGPNGTVMGLVGAVIAEHTEVGSAWRCYGAVGSTGTWIVAISPR